MPDWVTQTHDEYDAWKRRDTFVWDHYTGEALVKARQKARAIAENVEYHKDDDGSLVPSSWQLKSIADLGTYLFRRAQGEHPHNFDERARVTRFPFHMAKIVDAHVGNVIGAGYESRVFVDEETGETALGDPQEPGTAAYHLMENADGEGTPLRQMLIQAALHLILNRKNRLWYIVEGRTDTYDWPSVKIVSPQAVRNFFPATAPFEAVILHEEVDTRESIADKWDMQDRYVLYDLEGWRRYDEEGNPIEEEGAEGQWRYVLYDTPDRKREVVPVRMAEMQLARDVSKAMAEGENYLFNFISDIRNLTRTSNHPRLRLAEEDSTFDRNVSMLRQGGNVVQGDADYIAPPIANAQGAFEMYQEEVAEYYETAFQQMNDAARERTATEIRQEDKRGREAFLTVLQHALEQVENDWLYLLSQVEAPEKPKTWTIASATRSTEFQPMDPAEMARVDAELFFGANAVPASTSSKVQIAKQIQAVRGYEERDEEALEEAVVMQGARQGGALGRRMGQLRQLTNGTEEENEEEL